MNLADKLKRDLNKPADLPESSDTSNLAYKLKRDLNKPVDLPQGVELDTKNLPFAKFEEIVNSSLTKVMDEKQSNNYIKIYKLSYGNILVAEVDVHTNGPTNFLWNISVKTSDLGSFDNKRNEFETLIKSKYF
jgi:hypothetical protein